MMSYTGCATNGLEIMNVQLVYSDRYGAVSAESSTVHLSERRDATDEHKEDDGPRQEETECQMPDDRSGVLYPVGHLQNVVAGNKTK